ncbi:MAG: type III-A CRISPR-associated RAMP protein Csm5 [Desulfobacteraceae bacterium]
MKRQTFKCMIRTLAPIHLGCDEVYEPMSFTVDEENGRIVVFDPFYFIGVLDPEERAQFAEICKKGTITSILEVYKFLRNKKAEGRDVPVCKDFLEHYNKTLSLPLNDEKAIRDNLNKFQIPRTAFLQADQRPYIPGSAIKGALRTGTLNASRSGGPNEPEVKSSRQLEEMLLNYHGIPGDPFRMVKVSDFRPVGPAKTRVIYAVNEKKKPSDKDSQGLPLLLEAVQSETVFEGSITVDEPLEQAGIRRPLSLRDILRGSDSFFRKEMAREAGEPDRVGAGSEKGSSPSDGAYLLRIGKHSGAECVTVEGYRDILIRLGRKKTTRAPAATTVWLASEQRRPSDKKTLLPFGWVEIVELTPDQKRRNQEMEREWQLKAEEREALRRAEKERAREEERRAREQRERRAREEAERKAEEERRKAELEAMSPEQRDIARLSDPAITEKEVVEIFNRINQFSAENRPALARALKGYWQEHGKWRGKDLSKKQSQKVQRIKEILGEL